VWWTLSPMADHEPAALIPTHPDDATTLARWEPRGQSPIPIAPNERGLVWKTIVDLEVHIAIPQDQVGRERALASVRTPDGG
jgi:hypothetical protein